MASAYRPTGEQILLSVKPALRSIVLRSAVTAGVCVVLGMALYWGLPAVGAGAWWDMALLAIVGVVTIRVLWECAVWASRSYVLTPQRVISISGVLRRQVRDLPIERIQNIVLDRTLGERLLGLGTVGIASAGSAWIDVAWVMIAGSPSRLQQIREAVSADSAERSGGVDEPQEQDPLPVPKLAAPERPLVIGIAGGIGSGKSSVACVFGELGCVVIDSDTEAKRLLDEPDVLGQLREWWGDSVVDESGKANRTKIASIVFSDDEQRTRLEELIHPLVKRARASIIEDNPDARAIIIDAPLLFEAGVDAECDAVLFVDAPREVRLSRVRSSRDWDDAELARREASQWQVERKQLASDEVIDNSGSPEALRDRAEAALAAMETRHEANKMHKNPGN